MDKLLSAIKSVDDKVDYNWRTHVSLYEKVVNEFHPDFLAVGKELMDLSPEELAIHFEGKGDEYGETPEELLEEHIGNLREEYIEKLSKKETYAISKEVRIRQGLTSPNYFRVDEMSFCVEDVLETNNLRELDTRHFEDQKKLMDEDSNCPEGLTREEDEIYIRGDWISWLADDKVVCAEMISLRGALFDLAIESTYNYIQEVYPHELDFEFESVPDSPGLSSMNTSYKGEFSEDLVEGLKSLLFNKLTKFVDDFMLENPTPRFISLEDPECDDLEYSVVLGSLEEMEKISLVNFEEDLKKHSKVKGYKELFAKLKKAYEVHMKECKEINEKTLREKE